MQFTYKIIFIKTYNIQLIKKQKNKKKNTLMFFLPS